MKFTVHKKNIETKKRLYRQPLTTSTYTEDCFGELHCILSIIEVIYYWLQQLNKRLPLVIEVIKNIDWIIWRLYKLDYIEICIISGLTSHFFFQPKKQGQRQRAKYAMFLAARKALKFREKTSERNLLGEKMLNLICIKIHTNS